MSRPDQLANLGAHRVPGLLQQPAVVAALELENRTEQRRGVLQRGDLFCRKGLVALQRHRSDDVLAPGQKHRADGSGAFFPDELRPVIV